MKQTKQFIWSRVGLIAAIFVIFVWPRVANAKDSCTDRAVLIKDVTIPDKAQVDAGKSFEKV